ncbi:patatin-like phospholipase family protein [soil metagenome]
MPRPPRKSRTGKSINLALQGGGAHGAFGWGVMDALLEDGRIDFEAVSATSAGAMNAVVLAYGLRNGDREQARGALNGFWSDVSEQGRRYNPGGAGVDMLTQFMPAGQSLMYAAFDTMTRLFSPYQFNPFDFNPLREVLERHVDFGQLRAQPGLKLSICATNVETGKVRIFKRDDITSDKVLASACLPSVFQAVEVDGEFFWDGGYIGNPAIYPLIYDCVSRDVMIVHINPIIRRGVPKTPSEIMNRINEISFNSSLMREMRAIAFVTDLIDSGQVKGGKLKRMLIHSIRDDALMAEHTVASKFDSDWTFLCRLRDAGRCATQAWLGQHFDKLGVESSVDLRSEFL